MNDYGNALSPAKDFSKADALLVRSLEILLNRASSESLDSLFVVVLPWFGPILVPFATEVGQAPITPSGVTRKEIF